MGIRNPVEDKRLSSLDEIITEITIDAHGDDEQLCAFRQAFEDDVSLPADGFIIGEPVSVITVDYDGNERRGLTAKCRREDGSEYMISLSDVVLSQASAGALYIAAYRKWLNIDPYPDDTQKPSRRGRQHKAAEDDIDLSKPVELAVISVKSQTARCRLLGIDRVITLRASRLWDVVPGSIVTVIPGKQWRYAGHPYLSGEIQSNRIDVKALDLVPLKLRDLGIWDSKEANWDEEGESIEEGAKPIDSGPRTMFEMEQVIPGENPDDSFNDPITRSNDLRDAGDRSAAKNILMKLCQADLRCLDAHLQLGNLVYDLCPQDAIRHYEVGLQIGELSLGEDFTGVLPWSLIDNRPFLRCMRGYGMCLWRLGRFDDAESIFQQMLWLNPSDNLDMRLLIDDVKKNIAWEESENEIN